MNFALIVDKCKVSSYTVRDNKAYKLSDPETPYQFHHSIGNECFMGFWGYPFVFKGSFINWSEWETLPDLKLDLIFIAIESDYQKYTIEKLRKAYPNATIAAVIKETWNWSMQWRQRLEVYNQCDIVFSCVSERHFAKYLPELSLCERKVLFLPQPVNIDYMYNHYYLETRNESIFSYFPSHNGSRIGHTEQFTNYISKKYNIPFIRENAPLWIDFVKLWTPCTFHINLDPIAMFPGQQAMQCAAVGVIHIGGENDSHTMLWPNTATNNTEQLEYYINLYLTDYNKRIEAIQYAFNKVNEIYSYDSVYTEALKLLNL